MGRIEFKILLEQGIISIMNLVSNLKYAEKEDIEKLKEIISESEYYMHHFNTDYNSKFIYKCCIRDIKKRVGELEEFKRYVIGEVNNG